MDARRLWGWHGDKLTFTCMCLGVLPVACRTYICMHVVQLSSFQGGPMVNGIHPREACIRLLLFQVI